MILFIKHIDIEGPETLGVFLKEQGFFVKTINIGSGQKLPQTLKDVEAVISLGGPMNVYEEEKYSFLKEEDLFTKNVLALEIPFLGVCLGSQILAKAGDGKVVKSPEKEIGFGKVAFTEEGKCDTLFKGLGNEMIVFQWHEDMFEVPSDGILLARSQKCPRQAFRLGKNAYGLQFHVEITEESITEWSDAYFEKGNKFQEGQKQEMLEAYRKNKNVFTECAQSMYNNFLSMITGH